jgi:hypothetical protein
MGFHVTYSDGYNAEFVKLLEYIIYIKLYKYVELVMSWPVVVSEL